MLVPHTCHHDAHAQTALTLVVAGDVLAQMHQLSTEWYCTCTYVGSLYYHGRLTGNYIHCHIIPHARQEPTIQVISPN